jgi:hypothetical protein
LRRPDLAAGRIGSLVTTLRAHSPGRYGDIAHNEALHSFIDGGHGRRHRRTRFRR